MRILTIIFGLLLAILGGYYYATGDATSIFGLLPALFGVLMILMGLLQGRWEHRRPLYGSVFFAIMVVIGSLWAWLAWYRNGIADATPTLVRGIMGLLAVLFIVITVIGTDDFWAGWKAFGHFLGDWLARGVLTIFYFTIMVPFGIARRWFSDPLQVRSTPANLWQPRTTGDQTLEDVGRQY